ncbi:hypothetical protein N0P70_005499 [Klebsiella michiganensis]|nr:hypothetical protein [Klebsiella michiganensis]
MTNTTTSISVTSVGRVDGELCCLCPHCKRPAFLDEKQLSNVRGESFTHTGIINFELSTRCNGVISVSDSATFDRTLFAEELAA